MTGRMRIALHAVGNRADGRWRLDRSTDSGDYYVRDDGYKLNVWFTPADGVWRAQLVSPSGMNIGLSTEAGKADRVITWVQDPTMFIKPPAARHA